LRALWPLLRNLGRKLGGDALNVWTLLQHTALIGLPLSASRHQQLAAVRNALISLAIGTLGVWLAPAVWGLQHLNPFSFGPLLGKLGAVADRGDAIVIVPSLLVPLFLVLFELGKEQSVRKHQVWLLGIWLVITFVSAIVYVTLVASTVADTVLLTRLSFGLLVACLVLLYLYYLLESVPGNPLQELRQEGADLVERVAERMRAQR